MLKRIYAFCLTMILTVSLITALPVNAASGSEMQLIMDLGIIENFENTGLIPKSYTRGDFARSLCFMERNENPPEITQETASEYALDISDNKNLSFIVAAISRGYMKADEEGRFNPEKSISIQDAVIALVKMLGYEQVVQNNGGTYEDYYAIALKMDILKGVNVENSEKLSVNETAEILANAMNSRLLVPDDVDYGENCLWDRWGIVTGKGRILANSNMGLLTDKTHVNHINIDGTIYYTKLLIDNELVGSNVTYYIMDRGMGDEVVSIFVDSYSENVTLKADDIESVSDTRNTLVIKTEDDKTLKIDKKGFLIINGTTKSPALSYFSLFESGTATFVDSDNDGIYDVINMTLLYQTVIEGINADSLTLATRYDKNIIKLENADNFEVYLGKKASSLENLKKGMPVGIACDKFEIKNGKITFDFINSEYIRIYASNRSNVGYITALSDENFEIDDMKKLYGSAYKRLVKDGHIPELKCGDYVTVYYDNLGRLSYYELSDNINSMKYGYLVKAGIQGNFNKTTQVKILEKSGDFSIFDTGKTFILDGKKVNSGSVIYTVNENDDVDLNKRQLIRYRAVDGILKEIDTTVIRKDVERVDNSLDAVLPFDISVTTNTARKIRSGAVDRRYAFSGDCVVFIDEAPVGASDPSERQISVRTGSVSDGSYYISGYDSNIYNEISCVVRHDSYNEKEGDAKSSLPYYGYNCYIVKSVKTTRRGQDEWGWTVSLAGDSKDVVHFVSEDNIKLYASKNADDWGKEEINVYKHDPEDFTEVIKKGDVIRFEKNSADDIVYIEKMFDFEEHKNLIVEVPEAGGQIYGFAQVEMVNGNNVLYSYNKPDETSYVFRKRSVFTTVPLYHVSTGEVELVDVSQLPSRGSGNNVKVFLRYYNYGTIYDHIFYLYD